MSPRSISTALALAVALGAALFGTLCGGSKPPEKAATGVTSATAAKAIEYFRVDPATAGTLRGKIVFEGAKPARPGFVKCVPRPTRDVPVGIILELQAERTVRVVRRWLIAQRDVCYGAVVRTLSKQSGH